MIIRKPPLPPHALTALAVAATLAFPCVVQAVSIGEVALQSRLGEPLLVQIDLVAGSSEHIDDSCLFLAPPDPREDDTSGYLTNANLALVTEGKRQYVVVSSRKPFNEAFARMRLQVKCPGMGSVIKTLTILPDLDAAAPLAPITAPGAPAGTEEAPVRAPSDARDIAPDANQHAAPGARPDAEKRLSVRAAQPVAKRPRSPARGAGRKQGRPTAFRLKLSGDPIDESRIGKISAEERALLLARQKQLDADDQTASFLALQHQVKQLQDELGEIKLQLAQLGARPAIVASSVPAPATASPATAPQEIPPKPAFAVKPPAEQQGSPYLQNGLIAALGLTLATLALWLGLRYYTRIKSRIGIRLQQGTKALPQPAAEAAAPKVAISPAAKPPSQAMAGHAPGIIVPPDASAAKDVPAPPPHHVPEEEVREEDSMLEEARLYIAHGRPAKAVEILQELTKRFPATADAWSLLLSIYSSLGKTAEFEKTAREFLQRHKDSPAWSGIQALGRTLDRNNPLYADDTILISAQHLLLDAASPRRQIGDILMDMGALSAQDLQNCLDDFDPKKHGRFGGYLVARRAITLAQLDQALLQQQGVTSEAQPGELPSLQDMENFLADFDPKRDGSVGEFLASRKAVTPEQLGQLLQQPGHGTAGGTKPADEPPASGKAETLDFVLESTAEHPVLDLEFEPATEKDKPLDFEVAPSAPTSPEINQNSPDISHVSQEIDTVSPEMSKITPGASLDFPEITLDFGDDTPPVKKPEKQ